MSDPRQSSPRVVFTWLVVAAVAYLVWLVCVPNFVGSRTSKINGIMNNLRQLDGAKQQWALDHGQTGAVLVTEQDIAPYFGRPSGWVRPVAGERYILNRLDQSPEAELTHQLLKRPKGTRFSLSETNGYGVILPKRTLGTNNERDPAVPGSW